MDFDEAVQGLKKETTLNSAQNEKLYNIVSATERGDRWECHIVFPSLTFQNPEEGGNKPPKRRLLTIKKNRYNYLSFVEPWKIHSMYIFV